jgi:hypothetical protein
MDRRTRNTPFIIADRELVRVSPGFHGQRLHGLRIYFGQTKEESQTEFCGETSWKLSSVKAKVEMEM